MNMRIFAPRRGPGEPFRLSTQFRDQFPTLARQIQPIQVRTDGQIIADSEQSPAASAKAIVNKP